MIPKPILDLGAGVVIVFIVLLIILAILKIVQAVKKGSENGDKGEKRSLCIQSPQLQQILTNQALNSDSQKRTESIITELGRNFTIQQQLLGQLTRMTRVLAMCMAKDKGMKVVTGDDSEGVPGL